MWTYSVGDGDRSSDSLGGVSGLEFTSITIGQLIWPVAAVAIAFVLRKPLRSIGESSRLKEVEASTSGVKFAFEQILDSAEEAAGSQPTPTPEPESTPAPTRTTEPESGPEPTPTPEPEPTPESGAPVNGAGAVQRPSIGFDAFEFYVRMMELVAVSPRAAIVEAHSEVETLLRLGVSLNRLGSDAPRRNLPFRAMVSEAADIGIITPFASKVFVDLSSMRNLLTHDAAMEITASDAARYIRLAARAMSEILEGPPDAAARD